MPSAIHRTRSPAYTADDDVTTRRDDVTPSPMTTNMTSRTASDNNNSDSACVLDTQLPRLRNDLHCVEWDVKPYHTTRAAVSSSEEIRLVDERFIMEINQNATNYSYIVDNSDRRLS